ncbi:MAG: dTDP-glucose 4,6-dehydratase [Deltaproteobacteria bacterium]|nr:dTDP-glucose 4,6-dehydratase [Deltaproteobacteria bacterium]
MTRCLITGGAGFIGSNFTRLIVKNSVFQQVVVVDNLSYSGFMENLQGILDRIDFIRADVADKTTMNAIFADTKPNIVFHFAAESHVDRSILDPKNFVITNFVGTYSILECARNHRVEKFVHISTDEVYGSAPEGESFNENSLLNPSSPYSATKAGSDLLVMSYVKTFNFPAVITRSSNNYGPYQLPEKFIPVVITNLLENEEVPIYGNGSNIRNWIFVEDNCEAILTVGLNARLGEIFNIGGNKLSEISNFELAKTICNLLGKPTNLLKFVADRPAHDLRYSLNSEKINRELGWQQKTSLIEGLKLTIDWYVRNRDWWTARKKDLAEYYQKNYGWR